MKPEGGGKTHSWRSWQSISLLLVSFEYAAVASMVFQNQMSILTVSELDDQRNGIDSINSSNQT